MSQRKRQREREQQQKQRSKTRRERGDIRVSPDDSPQGNAQAADLAESRDPIDATAGHPNRRTPGGNDLRTQSGQSTYARPGRRNDQFQPQRSTSGPRREGGGTHRTGRHPMANGDHAIEHSSRRFSNKSASPSNLAVKHIARVLGETQRNAIAQIRRIINRSGEEFAQEMLASAWQVEKQGGMMTSDGTRRRTFGGVFFLLIKERLLAEDRMEELHFIFPNWRPKKPSADDADEAQQPAAPPLPVATWADRGDLIAEGITESGTINSVKVTLVGKLTHTVERRGFTLATMEYRGPLPALPRGIPFPEEVPTMRYVIYIGSRQWNKVKEALDDPEDAAIVEGTQIYDTETNNIIVFATNFTTKLIEHTKREAQKAQAIGQSFVVR